MKKIHLISVFMAFLLCHSLEAQQGTFTFQRSQIVEVKYLYQPWSSYGLVDITVSVKSVVINMSSVGMTVQINFDNHPFVYGADPSLLFFFRDRASRQDNLVQYNDVSEHDPGTLETMRSGFFGGFEVRNNTMVIIVMRGTNQYLSLKINE